MVDFWKFPESAQTDVEVLNVKLAISDHSASDRGMQMWTDLINLISACYGHKKASFGFIVWEFN